MPSSKLLRLSALSAFAPGAIQSSEIAGTSTNNAAVAGTLGEFISALVAVGSPQSLSTGTAANVTSISLTAGDWDVEGNVNLINTGSTVTAVQCGISATSATLPTDGSEVSTGVIGTAISETDGVTLPRKRISIAVTTTIYLVAKATFSIGTFGSYGSINARRVR